MTNDNQDWVFNPNDPGQGILRTLAPGVPHSARTGDEGAVTLDIFAPPRDTYRKPGEGFGV